jgi:hypothetical protein
VGGLKRNLKNGIFKNNDIMKKQLQAGDSLKFFTGI